jgi:hypothetical protein
MQWIDNPLGRIREYGPEKEFIITTNGGMFRPEVLQFMMQLEHYVPTKKKVLIVPCAADKPYPSPMHQACLDRLPDDYYLMNATGVLGLVPQDMWDVMPWYDSGIPNELRVYKMVQTYFRQHQHTKIVVYGDFNSLMIKEALASIGQRAAFVLPVQVYDDYLDLLDPVRLRALELALQD